MYAKSLEEDAASEWLDEVLSTNGKSSTSTTDGPNGTNGTNGTKKKAGTPKTAATKSKSKAGAAA
jgi:hypothetical protein